MLAVALDARDDKNRPAVAHSDLYGHRRRRGSVGARLRKRPDPSSPPRGPDPAPPVAGPRVSQRADGDVPESLRPEEAFECGRPDEEFQLLDFFETVALLANHGYLKDTDV